MLGDRYGTSLLPDTLSEKEFAALHKMADEHLMENRELIAKSYHLDENREPPIYKLTVRNSPLLCAFVHLPCIVDKGNAPR
jgi:hypothetical protein